MFRSFFVLLTAAGVLTSAAAHGADSDKQHSAPHKPPTRLYIASGALHTGDGAVVRLNQVNATIQNQSGEEQGKNGGKDDGSKKQKVVLINSGAVGISYDSLTRLLNGRISDGRLKDLKVTTEDGQVKITGKEKKGVDVPFEIKGPVKATPDGMIQLQSSTVKVAKLPGLAGLLGVTPKGAVGNSAGKGVHAQDHSIIFDPDQLWGLPVHGRVTKVTVQKDGLLLSMGAAKNPKSNSKSGHVIAKKRPQ
jgi:hypothetical protein